MKQLKLKSQTQEVEVRDPNLEELRAQRRARREVNQRVEALKVNLLRICEHNVEQAVRLIRRWLKEK